MARRNDEADAAAEPKPEPKPEPQASLWERLERPGPAPRTALTPQRIAEAAVAIADVEGIDAVTMRRLASELGVAPMAAYRYVSGKDDILELMIDTVYAELDIPEAVTDWREVMRANALQTRAVMLAHPWLVQISSPQSLRALTPNRMAAAERMLAPLDRLGLDIDTMMAVLGTVGAYVHGAASAECAQRLLMKQEGWSDNNELRQALAPQMSYLMSTGRYPTYHRYIREGVHKDDPQWRFETGLDCVLDGVAARFRL
ncbi:TetR/AcrR family transcriptional regulator C-terminal domain-containing protein [Streptomyces sp. MST-110588]|nr:TetR/AcrR family transcriptional regulator [Streptomyces sp. MST-110588]UNO44071.1 TetR/AcrR family transcriptional regulator C-terminal domain-containing protein [Streptomyces sp. MST-110588]